MLDPIQVRWTEPAAQDIEHIAEYIQKERPDSATAVARSLFDAVDLLGYMLARGRVGRIPGTRELVVSGLPYIIVYRLTSAAVQILRIYHGARDWPASAK